MSAGFPMDFCWNFVASLPDKSVAYESYIYPTHYIYIYARNNIKRNNENKSIDEVINIIIENLKLQ